MVLARGRVVKPGCRWITRRGWVQLAGHLLVTRGRPAGIMDWPDAGLGDPAGDLAGLYHWGGPRALEAALAGYRRPVDGGLVGRATYTALCVGLFDLDYGLRAGRPDYLVQGRRALRWAVADRGPGGATRSGARSRSRNSKTPRER